MTDSRRRFNARERFALYLATGGVCRLCGCLLEPGWHADHVEPYSKNGPTDVINGQALCAACNLKKGATMSSASDLRKWQRFSVTKYIDKDSQDYLQVATPGAGKTTFALSIARSLLESRIVQRVIVVVPTKHLRVQWRNAAKDQFGIQLNATFGNAQQMIASDYDGIVVTYAAVTSFSELYRHLSTERSTLVIFDEIHHAGDAKGWGDAIHHAFDAARRRLAITGTPFRSKGERIPFLRYEADPDGALNLHADDTYSYIDALRDGVCREVYFHTFEGEFEWEYVTNGKRVTYAKTFADELNPNEESQRLKTALSTETDWLPQVIRDADRRLQSIRENEFPDAAGLIIAMDRDHALRIASLVKKHIGEMPFVAMSDNPDNEIDNPSDIIQRFADGDSEVTGPSYRNIPRWLVAVKMVSEGVDIPRLCVGVYATNVVSELFFRQAVGRFVRVVQDAPGVSAVLFVPKDSRIVSHMERIREEVEVFVQEDLEEEQERVDRERSSTTGANSYEAIRSTAMADSILIGDEVYSREYIADVQRFQVVNGMEGMALELALKFYRKAQEWWMSTGVTAPTTSVQEAVTAASRSLSLDEEKQALKKRISKSVSRIAHATGFDHKDVHYRLNTETGARQPNATIDQLAERLRLVQEWEEEVRQGAH